MAISSLIMVQFSKFKIWHARHFSADLLRLKDVTGDVTRKRDDFIDLVTEPVNIIIIPLHFMVTAACQRHLVSSSVNADQNVQHR